MKLKTLVCAICLFGASAVNAGTLYVSQYHRDPGPDCTKNNSIKLPENLILEVD